MWGRVPSIFFILPRVAGSIAQVQQSQQRLRLQCSLPAIGGGGTDEAGEFPIQSKTSVGGGSMGVSRTLPIARLGVRNLAESFLPDHLSHLRSFFRRRRADALFPFLVAGSTLACALLLGEAVADGADAFRAAGFALLGTLMALALLEHWFMVLPLPFEALWRGALRSRRRIAPPNARKLTRFDVGHGTTTAFAVSLRMSVAASPGAAAAPRTALGRSEAT